MISPVNYKRQILFIGSQEFAEEPGLPVCYSDRRQNNDMKAAQVSAAAVQKACGNCHFAHREETSKAFLIKP